MDMRALLLLKRTQRRAARGTINAAAIFIVGSRQKKLWRDFVTQMKA
jgi:hypothetical protein